MPSVKDWRALASDQGLLRTVHQRLGLGVDITTWIDGTVEVRWRRDYEGEWSDERFATADSISAALEAILDYEDAADREDSYQDTDPASRRSP